MKRTGWWIIATLILALTLDVVAGQIVDRHGLKLGASMNMVTGPDAGLFKDRQSIIGLTGGGFATVKLFKKLSLQTELLVSQKGFAYNPKLLTFTGPPPEGVVFGTRVTYFDLPLLMTFSVSPVLDIYAGPYWGMFIIGRGWHTFGSNSSWHVIDSEDAGAWDSGYAVGAAVRVSHLLIDFRYQRGNKPIFDKRFDLRNQQLILLAGYWL